MRQGGTGTVTGAADQGQPAAAVVGRAGGDLLLGGQGQADPLVCAGAAVVGVVVNTELEVDTVLDILLVLGHDRHGGSGIGVVSGNNGEALGGVGVAGLGLVNGGLLVGIGLLIGVVVLACKAVGGPHTVACGRGTDGHHGDHGEDHQSTEQQSNDALSHGVSPFKCTVFHGCCTDGIPSDHYTLYHILHNL